MKLKMLVLTAILACSTLLGAKQWYIAPNFGFGPNFKKGNQFGLSFGADFGYNVWENKGVAPGNMYAGATLNLQWWVPTNKWARDNKSHFLSLPIEGLFAYEFKVDAGPLTHVGPFIKMGIGVDIWAWSEPSRDSNAEAAFAWSLGANIVFDKWFLRPYFGGTAQDYDQSYFMVDFGYRF